MTDKSDTITAGGAIFTKLKAVGVDYVFVNSGTDFPPIIEGLSEAAAKQIDLPVPIVMPHEMAAVGMAHGYYLGSGKPPCVMLHTNVGLANGSTGVINAAMDRVPLIVMSGRTPTTEQGRFGSRTVPIGWGQEMFDQTAYVRECTKWDYELRFPEQLGEVIDRAHAISNSTPKGPVYISLPRETLCEEIDASELSDPPSMQPVKSSPDLHELAKAADLLKTAKNPLVVGQFGINEEKAFLKFKSFAEDWAFPVSQYWPIKLTLPFSHPMSLGTWITDYVTEADVILVLDALAPWWPEKAQPSKNAKIIQLGPDPLFSRTPIRNFRADVNLVGETEEAISTLIDMIGQPGAGQADEINVRRKKIEAISEQVVKNTRETALKDAKAEPSTKVYVAHVLTKLLADEDAAVFSELGIPPGPFEASQPCSWFQEPLSGGLGWSFPAALGYKLARPEKVVVTTMGDGSYMFANPTVCHQIAEAMELPVITVVLNNEEWGAVRNSVVDMYPNGYAAKANEVPLTALKPTPEFTLTARASRAHTFHVKKSADVEQALWEAIQLSKTAKNDILVEIAIQ